MSNQYTNGINHVLKDKSDPNRYQSSGVHQPYVGSSAHKAFTEGHKAGYSGRSSSVPTAHMGDAVMYSQGHREGVDRAKWHAAMGGDVRGEMS